MQLKERNSFSLCGLNKNFSIPACSGGFSEPEKSESPSSSISNTLATLFPWSCVLSWVGPMEATQEGLAIVSLLQHGYCRARGSRRLPSTSSVSFCYCKSERKYLWRKTDAKEARVQLLRLLTPQSYYKLHHKQDWDFVSLFIKKGQLTLSVFIPLKHNILTNCGKGTRISALRHKIVCLLPEYLSKQDTSLLLLPPPGELSADPSQKCEREIPDFTTGGLCWSFQ